MGQDAGLDRKESEGGEYLVIGKAPTGFIQSARHLVYIHDIVDSDFMAYNY